MNQNLLELTISDADSTAIDAALATLETKLGSALLNLTIDQRKELNKMGNKSEAFCRQTLITARQNEARPPADTIPDLTASEGDLAGVDKLRPRLAALNEKAEDSEMALGGDVMEYSLYAYGLLKAIGAGGGLDALRAQMGARFARGPRKAATPPA
jgi:hypothetical protein